MPTTPAASSPAPPITAPEESAACRNCGASRKGDYCHRCGQRFLDGRLTFAILAHEVAAHFSAERGLLRTVREMVVAPGGMIRDYLSGRRRGYVSPITYLFFGAALSLLSFRLYRDEVAALAHTRVSVGGDHPLFSPEQAAAYVETLLTVSQQTAYTGILMCLPFAILLRLAFRGTGINLAEAVVLSIFGFAHVFVVQSFLITPLVLITRNVELYLWVTQVLYVLVFSQIAVGFFGSPLRSILKINLVLAASFVIFTFLLAGGITAYVLLFR